jgi:Tol biopolymer transport system component
MLAKSDRFSCARGLMQVGAGVIAVLLAASPGYAFFRWTPSATRLTAGSSNSHSWGRSWGYYVVFASRENLDPAGPGTGGNRQIFRFNLLNYACQKGQPSLRSPDETTPPCPATPQPYIKQITSGAGDADNPSVTSDGKVIAFEADGAFNGGGRGVGRRQVHLWVEGAADPFFRVTESSDGDSTRPTLNAGGGKLAFETTAALLAPGGKKQIYLYNRELQTLEAVTHGSADSTQPMLNKIGTGLVFQSSADLLRDGSDTGISQIFYYDKSQSDRDPGTLRQITDGSGPSRNPFMEEKNPGRVYFDSEATDLPGTGASTGRQVYAASVDNGDLPTVEQITIGYGNCTFPAVDSGGDRVVFICDGDPLNNGTSGKRLFSLHSAGLGRTLYQITGRGTVDGPIGASVPWFLTAATDNDMAGTGNCGTNLYLVDYWPSHYYEPGRARLVASTQQAAPVEPPPGSSNGGCDDGNSCTQDICQGGQTCSHSNAQEDSVCGSGDVCTGIPVCRSGRCEAQPGLVCTDGDACTTDVCNASLGQCQFPPLPAQTGGVQCHQVTLGGFGLPARPARVQARLIQAMEESVARPKAGGRMRAAKKARKLAERLANLAAADSGVDHDALQTLLDELRKVIAVLQELVRLLSGELRK